MDVNARYFAEFHSEEDLKEVLNYNLPIDQKMILGGGSNVLFRRDYDGLILLNKVTGIQILREEDDDLIVRAGAGENWHSFVLWCIERGLGGVENLSLIPGNVGASPMQNIGAYGVEIKEVFESLEALHLASGEIHRFTADECEFGYRESVFKRRFKGQYAILYVTYRLSRKPQYNTSYGAIEKELERMGVTELSLKCISHAVTNIRQSKLPDPKQVGNAGSFFKNPVIDKDLFDSIQSEYPEIPSYPISDEEFKVPAGWLIEKAGWKGRSFGEYGVHDRQALVLVNYGNAQGEEIFELSEKILLDINQKFGIKLEREVNIV